MIPRAKKTLPLNDEWRDRIKVGMILTRLHQFVEGTIEMSPAQVKAASVLLSKKLADLSSVELLGKNGKDLEIKITRV